MIKNKIRNRLYQPIDLFITLSIFGLLSVLVCFLASHGKLMEKYFFFDVRDTGMDFFHSMEFLHGNNPYIGFRVIYPPLANLLFRIFYSFVSKDVTANWPLEYVNATHMVGTELDLRTYQSTMMCFIAFILISAILVMFSVESNFPSLSGNRKILIVISILFSYGMINAFERGNIIIFSICFLLIYIGFFSSENKFIQELSIILLALSAGLKLHPAFFGILLLKEKNFPLAFRAIIYGLILTLAPVFLFEGDAYYNLWLWVHEMLYFSGGTDKFLILVTSMIQNDNTVRIIETLFLCVKLIMMLGFATGVLFDKNNSYKTCLYISSFICLISGNTRYALCYYLIPLFMFLKEEGRLDKKNSLPFALMTIETIPLPIFNTEIRLTLNMLIVFIVFIFCVTNTIKSLFAKKEKGASA